MSTHPSQFDLARNPLVPQEVWDNVIDLAEGPKLCALVCRAWIPRSQSQIFRHVNVKDEQMLRRLLDVLRSRPDLGNYIKTLSFSSQVHGYWPIGFPGKEREAMQPSPGVVSLVKWPWMVLVELKPFLSNLQQLSVGGRYISRGHKSPPSYVHLALGFDSEQTPELFMDAIRGLGDTLYNLRLSIVKFPSFEHFVKIISLFPRLRSLHLSNATLYPSNAHHASFSSPSSGDTLPAIEDLSFHAVETSLATSVCQWLLHAQTYRRISSLNIVSVDCSPASLYATVVGELIRACGPSLRHVTLEISNVIKIHRDAYFSFNTCISLRSLTIKQRARGPKDHNQTKRLQWLVSILSTIPNGSTLENLEVEVCMPFNPHQTEDATLKPGSKLGQDFAQLDAIFTGNSVENAKHIKFSVMATGWGFDNNSMHARKGDIISRSKAFPLSDSRSGFEFRPVHSGYEGYDFDYGPPDPDSEDD